MARLLTAGIYAIFLASLLLNAVLAGKNFYDILQVSKTASDAQIKRAYRKLALQYHPDKNKGDEEATTKFAEINNAYEILSDPDKRKTYDRHGEEGLKQQQQGGGGGGAQDIFSQFFGGGGFGGFGGFGGREEEEDQTVKGETLEVQLEVTLKDLYIGRNFKVTRDKNVLKPAKGTRKCNCKNKMQTKQIGPGMFQQFQTQECEECPNVKFAREDDTLSVEVEKGMKDGQEINFFEEGEPVIDGEPGDLKFKIKTVQSSAVPFKRERDNLHYDLTISLVDALVGFSVKIDHLDGHKVEIANTQVTKPGEVLTILGEGMPQHDRANKFGNLLVHITVSFPKSIPDKLKDVVRKEFAGL